MAVFCFLLILALTHSAFAADKPASSQQPPARLYIKSGTLVSGSGEPIEVRSFRAVIQDGHVPGQASNHSEQVVTVESGQAFLSNDSLSKLLNDKLREHKLEDIRVSSEGKEVKVNGKAKKGIAVPFSIKGPVSLTSQGYILLKTETTRIANLPGLAEVLGVDPKKLAGDGSVKGVHAEKDSISFDPDLLWDLPVHGKVTRVTVEKNGLMLVFGNEL